MRMIIEKRKCNFKKKKLIRLMFLDYEHDKTVEEQIFFYLSVVK